VVVSTAFMTALMAIHAAFPLEQRIEVRSTGDGGLSVTGDGGLFVTGDGGLSVTGDGGLSVTGDGGPSVTDAHGGRRDVSSPRSEWGPTCGACTTNERAVQSSFGPNGDSDP
jgi:hypothetical protein